MAALNFEESPSNTTIVETSTTPIQTQALRSSVCENKRIALLSEMDFFERVCRRGIYSSLMLNFS